MVSPVTAVNPTSPRAVVQNDNATRRDLETMKTAEGKECTD